MKHFPKLVLTFIISMITIFVIASSVEINRDAVGMYIVVFLFPALFVGFINMMALLFACEINSSKPFKIALITLPVIIGIGLIFFGEGQLKFVGIFAAISTAIVNSYYSWRILV